MQVQLWWQSHTSSSLPLSSILYREEAIAAGATWHIHKNTALSAAALSLRFNRNPNLTSRRFRLVTFTSNATFDDGDTRNDNVNDTGDRGDDDDDDDDDEGVEIEIEVIGKRRRRIRSKIAVNASLQNVWEVLTDYERLADFIPGLAVSQLLQKEHNFARLLQIGEQDLAFGLKFNAKGIVDCYEKDLEDLPIGQRRDIEFKMVEGDFKLFEGKWSIEQCNPGSVKEHDSAGQPFHTTLFYIVDVEPKLWLPVRVIEGRLCKEIKTNLRSVREEAQKGPVQHNILEIGAPVYELSAYYVGTPTREKFQHNILEIGAPVYELPTDRYIKLELHYNMLEFQYTYAGTPL